MHTNPMVRFETLRLYEQANIGGQQGMFDFVQNIFWVREAEATVASFHGDQEVAAHATYGDVRDFLSCALFGLEHAGSLINLFQVNSDSTLNICVLLSITDRPMVATTRLAPDQVRFKHLKPVPFNWYFQCEIDVDSHDVFKQQGYERLAPRPVAVNVPVFESLDFFRGVSSNRHLNALPESVVKREDILEHSVRPYHKDAAELQAAVHNLITKGAATT